MKILTLNTWHKSGPWRERWEVISAGLYDLEPDIVAFQELFTEDQTREVQERSSYPFLAHHHERSGLVIMSRFPIRESAHHTMVAKSPFEDYSRYVLWAEMEWEDRPLSLFNTHLSWKPEDGATRKAQMKELWAWARPNLKGANVLVGDLNATPDSEEIAWLRRESEWADALKVFHPDEPGYSWDNRNRFTAGHVPPLPDRRLDYIFVGGKALQKTLCASDLVFTKPDARGIFASDHFGILAEFDESEESL